MRTREVKAIVIACNTASAYALDTVAAESDIPIIGVINAGARTAVQATRNGKIGVIGTEGTIGSGIYTRVMKQLKPDIQVTGKPCPLFVPLVEEGLLHDSVTDEIASRYLSVLKGKYIDTLVLGCTHYCLLYTSDTTGVARYNGQDTISIGIKKLQSAAAMDVSKAVNSTIENLKAQDPNLDMVVVYDSSDDIQASLKSVMETMVMAVIISMIIIFLFFGEIKASLIVGTRCV